MRVQQPKHGRQPKVGPVWNFNQDWHQKIIGCEQYTKKLKILDELSSAYILKMLNINKQHVRFSLIQKLSCATQYWLCFAVKIDFLKITKK